MTVTATNADSGPLVGNGSTTAFPFTLAAASAAEVTVSVDGTTVSSSSYSVTLNANGGTVTFTSAPATGAVVVVSSDPDFTQDANFENNGAFLPATFNQINDRAAIRDIYLKGRLDTLQDTVDAIPEAQIDAAVAEATAAADRAESARDDAVDIQTVLSPLATARLLQRLSVLEDAAKPYLPAVPGAAATWHAIRSVEKLLASYAGPAYRGIRNSDSAAVDLNFTGHRVAPGDISVLRGSGAVLRLDKLYDQTGTSARDATQTTAAKRPCVLETVTVADSCPILIDGRRQYNGTGPDTPIGFNFTDALTGQSVTHFLVIDPSTSIQQQTYLEYYTGGTNNRDIFQDAPAINTAPVAAQAAIAFNGGVSGAGINGFPGNPLRSQPVATAFREQNAPMDMFIETNKYAGKAHPALTTPGTAPDTAALTTGTLGYAGIGTVPQFDGNFRFLAHLAVSGTLTDAEERTILEVLRARFQVPMVFDNRVVLIGDSILEGNQTTYTLGLPWYLRQQNLTGLPEIYNNGIAGKTLAACFADRTVYDATIYRANQRMIYFIQGGENDLRGGTSAVATYAIVTSYITYLKSLGSNVRVAVCTVLKDNLGDAAAKQRVVDYNALVRANTAGADAICDMAAETHVAVTGSENNVTLFPDGVHPSSLAYSYLAPIFAAVQRTLAA